MTDAPAATVRAVLFDMDGTLIDSTGAVTRSWRRWAEQWGVGDVFDTNDHGRPARQIVADHVPADRVDEAFAAIERLEVEDTAGIVVLPGVRTLLDGLPRDRWAVATSCTKPLADARIRATELDPPVLVTASDTERGKPSPDPYLLAARLLGVDPGDCLVVEDAPTGLLAGRAAGCTTLGVVGTVERDELVADLVADSLERVRIVPNGDRLDVFVG